MIKWPVEETGMNSVSPSTIPRMTAMAQFPTVLPGALRPLHFFHREFDDRRQQRNENHDGDDHVDALADIGKCLAEEVAAERRGEHPKDAAPDVVRDEAPVVHAGPHRGEGADDRNEACDDDRETAVLLVELLRGKQMLAAEDERVLALENFGPGAPSDRVADRVAGDGGDAENDVEGHDVEIPARGEDARGDEQRVAGEQKAAEKPGLDEDDRRERGQAADADDRLDVVNPMKQVPEGFHAGAIESAGIENSSNVKDIDRHVKASGENPANRAKIKKSGYGAESARARGGKLAKLDGFIESRTRRARRYRERFAPVYSPANVQ